MGMHAGRQTNTKIIIIIMYIYHALIKALSTHMIHINLNIFYTHVEHSPTKTIYIKYYTKKIEKIQQNKKHYKHIHTHARAPPLPPPPHTHTYNDCSRNWVLVLVRIERLGEEEGFQFGFKR